VYGSTIVNLGIGGPSYNAQSVHNPVISGTDKVVGSGALVLSPARSQYVQVPTFTSGGGGLSFAFWIQLYKSPYDTASGIFDFGTDDGLNRISLTLINYVSGNCSVSAQSGSGNSVKYFSIGQYADTWKHVAWTLGTDGYWRLYLNGDLLTSFGSMSYPTSVTRTSNQLGYSSLNGYSYLNGALDEFYYFPSVLSAAQVQALYLQGKPQWRERNISPLRLV